MCLRVPKKKSLFRKLQGLATFIYSSDYKMNLLNDKIVQEIKYFKAEDF